MRFKVLACMLFSLLICGSAIAEHTTVPKGTNDSHSDWFLCTYCEENQSYYIMIKSQWKIGDFIIPLTPRYHIYQIDHEFMHSHRVFSTPHIIYSLLSTGNYLFYERESFLHPISTEILCYDYQNKTHTLLTSPGTYQLLAANNEELIYFSQTPESGVYSYALSNQSTTLLFRSNKVISCSDGLLVFQENDGASYVYSLDSKRRIPLDTPSDQSITYAGYGVFIDEYKGTIWNHEIAPVYHSMLNSLGEDSTISSIGVNEKYVCAYSPSWKNHNEMGSVMYFPMSDWSQVSSFCIKGSATDNVNLLNNYIFYYDYSKNSLIIYNLDNKEIHQLNIG